MDTTHKIMHEDFDFLRSVVVVFQQDNAARTIETIS